MGVSCFYWVRIYGYILQNLKFGGRSKGKNSRVKAEGLSLRQECHIAPNVPGREYNDNLIDLFFIYPQYRINLCALIVLQMNRNELK